MATCKHCQAKVKWSQVTCPECGRNTGAFNLHSVQHLGCLLAFICIIGVLIAILAPIFASARVASGKIRDLTLAKGLFQVVAQYAQDSDDHLPPIESSSQVTQALRMFEKDLNDLSNQCEWNRSLSEKSLSQINNPSEVWLFKFKGKIGLWSARMDGSVRSVPQ